MMHATRSRRPFRRALAAAGADARRRRHLAAILHLAARAGPGRGRPAVASLDEASLYNPLYQQPARTPTAPTPLLLTALGRRAPGRALDVGMGQGRNALAMARRGWKVTDFDVAAEGLSLDAVEASDLEFDFGQARWDLIAILYPIEKRSVFRVREAIAPGSRFEILFYEDAPAQHEWARKRLRMVKLIARKP